MIINELYKKDNLVTSSQNPARSTLGRRKGDYMSLEKRTQRATRSDDTGSAGGLHWALP